MSEVISNEAIKQATGETWQTWIDRLEAMGAKQLPHKDIATKLMTDYGVAGWWAQSLTVRYEQQIGRRAVGQNAKGEYSVAVSKTYPGTMDQAMRWWQGTVGAATDFNGVPIVTTSLTQTEKWRYYRAALMDKSRIIVTIYEKTPTKAAISLQHEKIAAQSAVETWRTYWKAYLK